MADVSSEMMSNSYCASVFGLLRLFGEVSPSVLMEMQEFHNH